MSQLKEVRQKEFSLLSLFVLFQSSADCVRLTHIREAICFTQSTHSNVNLINRHIFTDTSK